MQGGLGFGGMAEPLKAERRVGRCQGRICVLFALDQRTFIYGTADAGKAMVTIDSVAFLRQQSGLDCCRRYPGQPGFFDFPQLSTGGTRLPPSQCCTQ